MNLKKVFLVIVFLAVVPAICGIGCGVKFAKNITEMNATIQLASKTTSWSKFTPRVTYISTACVVIEIAGIRFITDPVFDKEGSQYSFAPWYLPDSLAMTTKTNVSQPSARSLGTIDVALVSHDHHIDNLDLTGRKLLQHRNILRVVTTVASQKRLSKKTKLSTSGLPIVGGGLGIGKKTIGLKPWQFLSFKKGNTLVEILATPAQHGPKGIPNVHEVIGFLVRGSQKQLVKTFYISGDTVFIKEMNRFSRMFRKFGVSTLDYAFVHFGGAQLPKLPFYSKSKYSFTAKESFQLLRLLRPKKLIPIHFEDWTHFKEGRKALKSALLQKQSHFRNVLFLRRGIPTVLD